MKKATRQEAIDLVPKTENLIVVFSNDSCAICKKFIPEVLEAIEPALTHVTMVNVNTTLEKPLFGPDAWPTTYCFKSGIRIDWIKGSGPLDGVRDKLLSLYPLDVEESPSPPQTDPTSPLPDAQPESQGNEG
jgi:thioredoxin-like negative regulator of GroEL